MRSAGVCLTRLLLQIAAGNPHVKLMAKQSSSPPQGRQLACRDPRWSVSFSLLGELMKHKAAHYCETFTAWV